MRCGGRSQSASSRSLPGDRVAFPRPGQRVRLAAILRSAPLPIAPPLALPETALLVQMLALLARFLMLLALNMPHKAVGG